jgi:ABC-type maltose transport system permease subunit
VFGTHVTNVFLVRGFINSIPREIDEAATIDGCGFMGILYPHFHSLSNRKRSVNNDCEMVTKSYKK